MFAIAKVFKEIDSSPQSIVTAGIRFLLAVYGAPKKMNCREKYRYLSFVKNIHTCKKHLYRVYRLGNQLNTEGWGWKLNDNTLEPIQTLLLPASEKLLNSIFCNCKKDCSAKCRWQKSRITLFTSVY